MNIVSQTVGGVPVTYSAADTSGDFYIYTTDPANYGYGGPTVPTNTTTVNIPTVWITPVNRTQILPGVYLNHDEHKLERG